MKIGWILITALFLSQGCGRKAPPIPYGETGGEAELEAPLQFSAIFREDRLRLQARWPGYKTKGDLLVEALQSPPGCNQCEAEIKFRLYLKIEGPPNPLVVGLEQRSRLSELRWRLDKAILIEFPPQYFSAAPLSGGLRFRLVPMSAEGERGMETPELSPKQPRPLARPQVKSTHYPACAPPACAEGEPQRLLLTWPGAEDLGNGVFLKRSLGINLYQITLEGESFLAGPLHQGHHWLVLPRGTVLARSVDAWGNESAAQTLYEADQSQ